MTHDWFAFLHDNQANEHLPHWNKRQQETILTYTRSGETQNKAKERARQLTDAWGPNFPYVSPGDTHPFCSRCVGLIFSWTLKTPFFSRSENELDAIDNPLFRDSLSGAPMLRATGAKGMLKQIVKSSNAELARILFGEATADDGGDSGRIVFGDVVFDRADVDVFSPHLRQFGVVDKPIIFEVVPAGAKADWGMMLFERGPGELHTKESLLLILDAVQSLLQDYGMSAKRSSGYGLAAGDVKVTLRLGHRLTLNEAAQKFQNQMQSFPKPEPAKPKISKLPSWHEAIVQDGKLTCTRDKALDALVAFQIKKNKASKAKQIENIKKDWSKKDKALTTWDDCSKWLETMNGAGQAETARQQAEYQQWEREKKEWARMQPIVFDFPSIDTAMQNVKSMSEVTP